MLSRRLLAASLALAGGSLALGRSALARPEKSRVDRAVDKGAAWVKGRQQPDGSWRDRWASAYPVGETAISLLTLLKCGAAPDDAAVNKGFDWLLNQPFKKIYDVSISILALEARHAPKVEAPDPKNPYRTVARKQFLKGANAREKDWLQRASAFLVENQKASGLWNYPQNGDADVSNTQFALLALKSAKRLGIRIPPEVWLSALAYFVDKQDKTGNKVAAFDVPAADGPIDDVEDRKAAQAARAKTESHPRTGVGLEARGWGYKPGQGPRGSMTAAGVAALVLVKSELEGNAQYEKKLAPAVDRAIRDGCAWIADRFRADANPGAEPDWLFYWLYTLERAGTLAGVDRFGSHDWYEAGAEVILGAQKDDGHFEEGTKGELDGTLGGSCLALLFLRRATVPVIERTATGVGVGGGEGGSIPRAGGDAAPGVHVEKLEGGEYAVTFRVKLPGSQKVTVAGSWNGWDKDATPCAALADGLFEATVRVKAGRLSYKFVVNGSEWKQDPGNDQAEDDGHGGKNSVVNVGG